MFLSKRVHCFVQSFWEISVKKMTSWKLSQRGFTKSKKLKEKRLAILHWLWKEKRKNKKGKAIWNHWSQKILMYFQNSMRPKNRLSPIHQNKYQASKWTWLSVRNFMIPVEEQVWLWTSPLKRMLQKDYQLLKRRKVSVIFKILQRMKKWLCSRKRKPKRSKMNFCKWL